MKKDSQKKPDEVNDQQIKEEKTREKVRFFYTLVLVANGLHLMLALRLGLYSSNGLMALMLFGLLCIALIIGYEISAHRASSKEEQDKT